MADFRRPGALRRGAGRHGGARRRHPRRPRAASWSGCWSIRRSTPPAPAPGRSDLLQPDALSRPCRRARRAVHLSRPRPARGLCDARPAPARARTCAASSRDLEEWTIRTLARFNVTAERRAGRVGVWVGVPTSRPARRQPREDKIAAIGVRIRHWVTFHGISINVEPDLSHYAGIVPCGIAEHGVTSLVDLGLPVTLADLDMALRGDVRGSVRLRRQAVGSWRKALAAGRSRSTGSTSTLSTRAIDGPRRQACDHLRRRPSSSPTISASTEPSRRLRTQPARPSRARRRASPSRDSRRPAPGR